MSDELNQSLLRAAEGQFRHVTEGVVREIRAYVNGTGSEERVRRSLSLTLIQLQNFANFFGYPEGLPRMTSQEPTPG